MSIYGNEGDLDLRTMEPSDYFKIGVAHGEKGWAKEPTYLNQPQYLEGYDFGSKMKPNLFPRDFRDVPVATVPTVPTALPQFPVISRGLPYSSSQGGQFGGPNDEANAIDSDYGTTWNSIFSPNDGSAEWYVLDLRTVPSATKSNVWMYWKNPAGNYYEPTATLGPDASSVFSGLPRNYKLQGHTSSGAQPATGDAGWVDLVSVTDNRYNQRIHTGLDLSTYNWFRFYCTASSGVSGVNDSVTLEFDLRDARGGTTDSIFFYGDSITWEGFNIRRPGNSLWTNGPLENVIATSTTRTAPVIIDGGVGGWTVDTGDANKTIYIGGTPCKYVAISFGSNDVNGANIDLNTQGGLASAYAINFKAKYQSMITYTLSVGKIPIIPRSIIWGNLSSWTLPNLALFNTIITQLLSENAGLLAGPDLYSFFSAHQTLIRDLIHPTYDSGGPLYNGLTGYENMHLLWRDSLTSLLYTG